MLLSDGTSFAAFLIDIVAVFIFVLWLWLLVITATDLFRRNDMTDVGKFLWAVLLVGLPYVGTFAYILSEGAGMAERKRAQAEEMHDALRQLVGFSPADELLKLDRLKAQNVISNEEYLMLRSRLVG
jgi:Phospholipase_D-nuclease N-terminal